MIKAGIIGATGYGGVELTRLLYNHPKVELSGFSSVSFEGKKLSDVYPALLGLVDDVLVSEDEVIEVSDVVFAALPHGLSQELAVKCNKNDKVFIDLGADFRLKDEATYKKWYDCDFLDKTLQEKAVYGLPELFEEEIKSAKIIANPGCYPTGAGLGLAPIVSKLNFDPKSIVIDAKSGITGAGRSPSETTHYASLNENFMPYKIGSHRHKPEIEQTIGMLSGKDVKVTFTPHLLPINRGILSTIYIDVGENISANELHDLYSDFYKDKFFVRILELGKVAQISAVSGSNFCDISVHVDEYTGKLIIVTAIDNMVKGAAGQAIQNMNIIFGLPQNTALDFVPPAF